MQSAIYRGTIRHRRFAEREHSFQHRIAMAYLDLDEIDGLLSGRLVRSRPGLVRFRRADYLGDPAVPLADAVRAEVARQTGDAPAGPVRLLTHLRTFGHCFNPVSFFYCFAPRADGEEEGGERLEAIAAEVTSTPWGERHAYVLRRSGEEDAVLKGGFEKALHVSPFMGMEQRYAWRAPVPGETASVHIESTEQGERAFDVTLAMERHPFTAASLRRITVRYPAATLRMLALIYGHAAALKLKGVTVKPHPGPA
jgi:DUF1365 family protein